jgi:hypothetical protein
MQTSGATDDGTQSPLVDNLVVSNERSQQFGQAKTPLFLPLDKYDPQLSEANRAANGISDEGAVYKQLGDNGVMPMFFAIINGIATGLTSSKWVVGTRVRYSYVVTPSIGDSFFMLNAANPGDLPHSARHEESGYPTDPIKLAGETGVPVDTGSDTDSLTAVHVELIRTTTGLPLTNLAGTSRVFGRSSAVGATPGNSVRINLFVHAIGANPTNPVDVSSYAWETGMPSPITLNVYHGYRQRLDQLDDVAFRRVFR